MTSRPMSSIFSLLYLVPALIAAWFGAAVMAGQGSTSWGIDMYRADGALLLFLAPMTAAAILFIYMISFFDLLRKANKAFFAMDAQSIDSLSYERYRTHLTSFAFLWNLLPALLLVCLSLYTYFAMSWDGMVWFDSVDIKFAKIETPLIFVLLFVAFLFVLVAIIVSFVFAMRLRAQERQTEQGEEAFILDKEPADEEKSSEEVLENVEELSEEAEEISEDVSDEAMVSEESLEEEPIASSEDVEEPAEVEEELPVAPPMDLLSRLALIDERHESTPDVPYASYASLTELCSALKRFGEANGYLLEDRSIYSLISSLSLSRLIFVNGSKEEAEAACDVFSAFFGNPYPKTKLVSSADAEETTDPDYVCGIYDALYCKDAVYPIALTDVSSDTLPTELTEYAASPESQRSLSISAETSEESPKQGELAETNEEKFHLSMSENLWFFLSAASDDAVISFSSDQKAVSALTVTAGGKKCPKQEGAPKTAEHFSREMLRRMTSKTYATHFLSEEQWKKMDKLEEFLNERLSIRFSNPLIRRMERYSSIYLACGGEINDAMDAMLVAMVLPIIANAAPEQLNASGSRVGIVEAMANIFGADNIPLCMRSLQNMGYRE